MRALKARSYGVELPMRALKAQSYGTHPSLHDRADTFVSTVYNTNNIIRMHTNNIFK